MFERIEKAYMGHHIALYACEMGELGDLYLGHYKIFAKRPRSFWDCGDMAADTVRALSRTPVLALDHALDLAKQKVSSLASRQASGIAAPAQQAVGRRPPVSAFS